MDHKLKYTIMLFYSTINQVSLNTRDIITKFINTHHFPVKITLQEVDYEQNKFLSKKYGIMGTPAILFLENGNLIKRLFGEVTSDEFRIAFEGVFKEKK